MSEWELFIELKEMLEDSDDFYPHDWQGQDVSYNPMAVMKEMVNVRFTLYLEEITSLDDLRELILPNLPWADDHFNERVAGQPVNPGVTYKDWPWARFAESSRTEGEQFNHNYMERYWPKKANGRTNYGIRGPYGDLDNLIQLLRDNRTTRQAYLPIFFPEDTGNANPGRKPCTLGYHFMIRNNQMLVYYPIRSCDFTRHLRDDLYLTARLGMYVRDQVDPGIEMGTMNVWIGSLHCFKTDLKIL